MEPESDRALMVRLAGGDRDALGPLMERHYRRLYRISVAYLRNPEDALDAVQETFVKVFQAAARWDGAAEVGPWLTRIAVNSSIDRYRRVRRRRLVEEPMDPDEQPRPVAADTPSPERILLGREIGTRIETALRSLPDKHRAVFVLRHVEQLSLEEIADTLGMSLGTVKSALHRAVHRLRERLERGRA
jgi:RNA polymerase sigma-70 factor (ECF subfamily)